MNDNKLATDIAVIKNELKNINNTLVSIAKCNEKYDDRITESEKKIAEVNTKIGAFAGIQVLFTAIVGGLITYFKQ